MLTLDFFRSVAIFFFLLLNLLSKGQSFLYHHPESVFLDTCIFESIQKARIITNTYISKGVFYRDTLSNMNTREDMVSLYKSDDSLCISIKKDFTTIDYLTIYFSNDTMVCRFPFSKMSFVLKSGEITRIANNSLNTLFNTSSFLEYLDFDEIRRKGLAPSFFSTKISYSDEFGLKGYEKYIFGKSIKSEDLELLNSYIYDHLIEKYSVLRIDLMTGFFDDLKRIYYFSINDSVIYKVRIWQHGALSIIKFDY
jgi:hypothetical protein